MMKNFKDKYQDYNSSVEIPGELEDEILNKTIYKCAKKRKFKLAYGLVIIIFIFCLSLSFVYAKEIKEVVNKAINDVHYKRIEKKDIDYEKGHYDKDVSAIDVIDVNGITKINKVKKEDTFESLEDMEKKLGIKFLKVKDLNNYYFRPILIKTGEFRMRDGGIEDPEKFELAISNFLNYGCDFEEGECDRFKTSDSDKYGNIEIRISFITQHVTKKHRDEFGDEVLNFPNWQNETYYSEHLKTKVYLPTEHNAKFVHNNMIYSITYFRYGEPRLDLKTIIENMEY